MTPAYTESGEFTHRGERYDLQSALDQAEDIDPVSVDDVSWVLDYDVPDPARVAKADTSAPILVTQDEDGVTTVVDGLHRLARAIQDGETHLPARRVELSKAAAMTPAPAPKPAASNHHRYLADDDEFEEYEPVGLDGLLAASEKLLAINRNLTEPDDRDSLPNDRIYTVDRLMAERVKLDHNRTLRNLVGRMSRTKNLSALHTNAFAPYTVGYLAGNPLTPALEEINPMHILEQKRRVTKMGPNGIGDSNAITLDMQSVSATQFGFIDPVAGPESEKAGVDIRLASGTRLGSDGKVYQIMLNRKTGKKQWVSPTDLIGKTLKLPD